MKLEYPAAFFTSLREFCSWCDKASVLEEYTVARLPDPAGRKRIVYVSNEAGGATIAFNDGTNWRRAQDRAICS